MNLRAHRAFGIFRRRLAKYPEVFQPWRGAAYRVTTLDYPSPASILLGQGSYLHGGRWNAPGSFRAVYGSTSDLVAVAESRANAEYAGLSLPFRAPRLLVTVELSLTRVIDLTDAGIRAQLEFDAEGSRREDWRRLQEEGFESVSQAFGRAAFASGASGLLVPSARLPEGVNVVYFPENRQELEEARVFEPEMLERIRGRED